MKSISFMKVFKIILHINILKTILVNFKYFPFSLAIKFPIFVFGHIDISGSGAIKFLNEQIVKTGLIRVGNFSMHRLFGANNHKNHSRFSINGLLIIGGRVTIGNGCYIVVEQDAEMVLGDNIEIGPFTNIYCYKSIIIGNNFLTSWNCQIFDTDFHFFSKGGVVRNDNSPILIGNNCWIGHHVTIQKRTILPDNTIVGACSLVNKALENRNTIVAGIPAKQVAENVEFIYDRNEEYSLREYFKTANNDEFIY